MNTLRQSKTIQVLISTFMRGEFCFQSFDSMAKKTFSSISASLKVYCIFVYISQNEALGI